MGLIDSLGQVFAVLAAVFGGLAIALYRAWQKAKGREREAREEADRAHETTQRERRSRKAAEDAQQEADEEEEKAVEEARKGKRDHFTKQ